MPRLENLKVNFGSFQVYDAKPKLKQLEAFLVSLSAQVWQKTLLGDDVICCDQRIHAHGEQYNTISIYIILIIIL